MYKILKLNKISGTGLDLLDRDYYEVASEIGHPDAILVRSAKIAESSIPSTVKAIARAGAGVNNIPVDACTDKGIIVFNTPGANANSVKELVLTAIFISSRKIYRAITWAKSLSGKGEQVGKLIEEGKSRWKGPEVLGKKLGVIGLGSIGGLVANAARSLGMSVIGYDPGLSLDAAWNLSNEIQRARNLEQLLAESDYITLHIPLNDSTRGIISKDKIVQMKKGVKLLNFSRGGLVNNQDLLQAIKDGIVDRYVTDFPDDELLQEENVIPIPHLGASTPEAEENCAVMAVKQLKTFLETGNITNSVNFPECYMPVSTSQRLIIANRNVPNMVGQITSILAAENINIQDMINRHKGDYAYNIIEFKGDLNDKTLKQIKAIEGIVMARIIES